MPMSGFEELPMFDCQMCVAILNAKGGKFKSCKTEWIPRVVGDTLPPGLSTMECTGCGQMRVQFVGNDGSSESQDNLTS